MGDMKLPPFMEYFTNIEDPRRETKNKKYPLIEVIVIAFLAVMSGADGWESMERYGVMRKKWLCKFLALTEGIPKHDVYRRVFSAIKSELLECCFMNWVRDIKREIWREVIDGKTVRGMATKSRFKAGTEAKSIHLVSAWATENELVFAQVQTEEKSNEITAIPLLLEQIAIAGCIVTIDAMGCQHEIADKIVGKEADYVFSLKGNQGTLHESVEEYWDMLDFSKPPSAQARHIRFSTLSTYDEKHGRKETRDYAISGDVKWLRKEFPKWKTINSIGMVESTRDTGGETKTERRYFVSSLNADEKLFAHAVRAHWGIENQLHYMLDVVYREDACRVRKDNSPRTLALIRKIALTIARSDKKSKTSIRGRVQQMAWSEDYLESLLFHSDFASVLEES
ncbi:MAG: ISAs1 family transposase [Treponema sp.]|jgi:predicted transposase YbfD/YdcC|nr:ISAs1 family transposase [Treponema sp.]